MRISGAYVSRGNTLLVIQEVEFTDVHRRAAVKILRASCTLGTYAKLNATVDGFAIRGD